MEVFIFSFFGSKSKIIKKYPKPTQKVIVETFAGSARYALEYWDRDVILYEIDPKIYSVWRFLQESSSQNILSLPDVENATVLESVNGFSQLSDSEKWLIGFCCNGGSAQPKKVSGRHNFNSWNKDKIRIANNLYKIREWSIVNDTYENIPNIEATWFVDPPYQTKGKWYKYHDIDYEKLARFVQGRNGQVIACDNTDATWLKFEPLVEVPFTHFKNSDDYHKTTFEGMWYKES